MERPPFDDLYTPLEAIKPLLPYLPTSGIAWECCDSGVSKITSELNNCGLRVVSTDKKTGFDFLKDKPDFEFDFIITNPPYSLKDKFISKCYGYGKPFALLLPLTALEGIKRGEMFRKYGISVLILDKRIDFTGKRAVWFNVSWFVYGLIPDNTIAFLPVRNQIQQPELVAVT